MPIEYTNNLGYVEGALYTMVGVRLELREVIVLRVGVVDDTYSFVRLGFGRFLGSNSIQLFVSGR